MVITTDGDDSPSYASKPYSLQTFPELQLFKIVNYPDDIFTCNSKW